MHCSNCSKYGTFETDLFRLLVPFGGLKDINLTAGETIIIAPATGGFGSAAVTLALAMGARVIAVGRNLETLKKLQASQDNDRIELFQITGDVQTDLKTLGTFGTIDAFLDLSPPEAANSTHFQTCMLSLRKGGRVSLMGGLNNELTIPVKAVVSRDLKIMGKWMYERQDVRDMIKMIEIGVLRLGGKVVEKFGLEDWEKAFDRAAELGGVGQRGATIIVP